LTTAHDMNILDSRRLTGPGLFLDGPGAVLDIRLDEAERDAAVSAWTKAARRLLQALDWENEPLASRAFPGGVSLAVGAPIDGLYAATELNERAWATATAELEGRRPPDFRADVASLLNEMANERNPDLVALSLAARARGEPAMSFLAAPASIENESSSTIISGRPLSPARIIGPAAANASRMSVINSRKKSSGVCSR